MELPPDICPNGGSYVPKGAQSCSECGACNETGWADEARTQNLDLPDSSFNYDEFVAQEFSSKPQRARRFNGWIYAITVFLLVVAMSWWLVDLLSVASR